MNEPLAERIRPKTLEDYISQQHLVGKEGALTNQIKKGVGGLKELLRLNKEGYSTALMIDQRVSQGIRSNFFDERAFRLRDSGPDKNKMLKLT